VLDSRGCSTRCLVRVPYAGGLILRRFTMAFPQPSVGDWYRLSGGELFEVVAVDDDDGTIEIQYFDGTVQEMDLEDWEAHCEDRALEAAEPPEDWSGSVDVEPEEEGPRSDPYGDERDIRASGLDGIDIFESR
jgi:hypothetical protein